MNTFHTFPAHISHCDLTRYLDDQQYICDPEFDFVTDELERQFDELRLSQSRDLN